MPTFTTIAWENLLEPKPSNLNPNTKPPQKHIYISPNLYTTPQTAPIPYHSGPPSPSPYVLNHKRRRAVDQSVDQVNEKEIDRVDSVEEKNLVNEALLEEVDHGVDQEDVGSVKSFVSNYGDFFDADEEFFSDGSTPRSSSFGKRVESELLATRLSLLQESEKRKSAEEAVQQMYNQWQRLGNLLSQNRLTLSSSPNATSTHFDIESLEQLLQELVFTRIITEEIGRGEARAEAELNAEVVIQSKDQEISRLRDKLRYYEAVNHEMCQRNQEVMEVARRQRQRKKTQVKWLWSCLGISVAIGSSVIAYSLLPESTKLQTLPSPSDSSDATCVTLE